jgi:pyridoxine 5'-phosphate synthase PdxJ
VQAELGDEPRAAEIVEVAVKTCPDQATLVPERRQEVYDRRRASISRASRIESRPLCSDSSKPAASSPRSSIRRKADRDREAARLRRHRTAHGEYANATTEEKAAEQLDRLVRAGRLVRERGCACTRATD